MMAIEPKQIEEEKEDKSPSSVQSPMFRSLNTLKIQNKNKRLSRLELSPLGRQYNKRLSMDASSLGRQFQINNRLIIDQEIHEEHEEYELENNNRNSSDSISMSQSSVSSSTLLPMHQRYRNKQELETYAREVQGKAKLDSYIVPDIEKILTILKKNMQK